MSFQPTIPLAGIAGWRFLDRTADAQRAAFEKGPQLARDIAHFKDKIATIDSAEKLVADRRVLKVALGAFGLEGEIDKKFFVRRALEEGTADPRSLANRLTDPAYRKLAEAFGFGNPGGAKTTLPDFADKLIAAYKTRQFEAAVGEVNDDMRLALNFRREIAEIAQGGDSAWFQILGSKPLRQVVEKAFGLPREFAGIDIDRQREVLRDKSRATFGEGGIAAFKDPENVEKLINRFLARAQLDAGVAASSPGSAALTLLQNASGGGSAGLVNLIASRA